MDTPNISSMQGNPRVAQPVVVGEINSEMDATSIKALNI